MTAAFAAGQLSYSKVRAMTRVATPKSERDLVAVALHGTASHIDRIVGGYRRWSATSIPIARGGSSRSGASGTTRATTGPNDHDPGRAGRDRGVQAGDRSRPAARCPKPIDEPKVLPAAHRFDALEHVARVFLEPDEHAAPRTEIVVHADLETLTEDEPGRCELEDGTGITGAAATAQLRQRAPPRPRPARSDPRHRPPVPQHPTRLAPLDRRPRPRHLPLPRLLDQRPAADPSRPALVPARPHQEAEPDPGLPLPPQGPARRRLERHRRRQRRAHLHRPQGPPDARGLTPTTPHRRQGDPREHAAAGTHITATTITPNWQAGERLDLDHAVQALWHLDPPTFN